jgi:uncharacterized protein
MSGMKNLDKLLKGMSPVRENKEYVFCSVSESKLRKLQVQKVHVLLVYREKEGITLILEKKVADKNSLKYSGVWTCITLTIHSDLEAVGFLARITEQLANANISVNAVSAYYHDHLFVPKNKSNRAMEILKRLSKK